MYSTSFGLKASTNKAKQPNWDLNLNIKKMVSPLRIAEAGLSVTLRMKWHGEAQQGH